MHSEKLLPGVVVHGVNEGYPIDFKIEFLIEFLIDFVTILALTSLIEFEVRNHGFPN